jgi:hypothetical protein
MNNESCVALPARLALLLAFGCLLCACALPVRQVALATPLMPAEARQVQLAADVQCRLGTGFRRTLRQGTHWSRVGTIARGDVYRSPDQTVTVEGYDVHEAYPVFADGTLVGFYLVVERTFSPLGTRVPVSFNDTKGD